MTKEPHFIILERFTAKNPAEYRLKKSISNLNSPFVEHVDAARKFLKKAGKKALPYLQEAMEEKWFEENTLMYEVPLVYADIGGPAIPVLVKWIAHEDPYFSTMAVSALEEIGSPAVPAICEAITGPDEEARIRAIDLLGVIEDIRAVPYLIKVLSEDAKTVRYETMNAITDIGPTCYPLILPLLQSDNLHLVCSAIELLPGLDHEKGIDAIMPCFADPRDEVWDAVFDSLVYLQPPPISKMCQYLSCGIPGVMIGAMNILGNNGDETVIPALERLLDHPDTDVRESAAWCIEKIKKRVTLKPGDLHT